MSEPLLDVGSHLLVAEIVVRLVADVGVDSQRLVRMRDGLEQRPRAVWAVQLVGAAVNHEQRQIDARHALFDARDGVEALGAPPHRRTAGDQRVRSVGRKRLRVASQGARVDAQVHREPREDVRQDPGHRDGCSTADAHGFYRDATDDRSGESFRSLQQVVEYDQ